MLAAGPMLALAAAIALGVLAGGAAYGMKAASSSSDWGHLGALIMGLFAGALVGLVAYLAALIFAAWRMFPQGCRALPVMLTLLGHIAVGGVMTAVAARPRIRRTRVGRGTGPRTCCDHGRPVP
ncbi:hypothetical protein [Actinoplanes sp. NPDC049681]|uniref:hypothetical protein n=1 Tax=Actinoplanes sp. NPDC049681 TaxID=3363905 RepID=UPI003791778A